MNIDLTKLEIWKYQVGDVLVKKGSRFIKHLVPSSNITSQIG